jgi:hypothetical protein
MIANFWPFGLVCIASLSAGLFPAPASAQIFRRPAVQPPVVNPQPAPVPAQPAPAPSPPPASVDPAAPATPAPPLQPQAIAPRGPAQEGQIIHGGNLIGLNVFGVDNQAIGIVRDFVIDYQGDCPAIYFAMEPSAGLQLGQEYVILPFSAMQYDFASGGVRAHFRLGVNVAQLRNSPRIAVNNWSTFHDRHLLSNAHQFYQRTERTAARPIRDGATRPDGTPPGLAPRPGTNIPPTPDNGVRREGEPRETLPNRAVTPNPTPSPEPNRQPESAPPSEPDRQHAPAPRTDKEPPSPTPRPANPEHPTNPRPDK